MASCPRFPCMVSAQNGRTGRGGVPTGRWVALSELRPHRLEGQDLLLGTKMASRVPAGVAPVLASLLAGLRSAAEEEEEMRHRRGCSAAQGRILSSLLRSRKERSFGVPAGKAQHGRQSIGRSARIPQCPQGAVATIVKVVMMV